MITTCTQPKPFERLLAARQALAKSDVIELERQIAATDQIIHRLRELLHRRILHRAMLVINKGERVGELCIDMLNDGSRPPYTPFRFCPTRHRHRRQTPLPSPPAAQTTLDVSTSQLPADFIDVDPDGHG